MNDLRRSQVRRLHEQRDRFEATVRAHEVEVDRRSRDLVVVIVVAFFAVLLALLVGRSPDRDAEECAEKECPQGTFPLVVRRGNEIAQCPCVSRMP